LIRYLCFLVLLGGVATAHAASPGPDQLSSEVGFGVEEQTSPLVQISPQGALINLPGLNRLAGSSARAALSGLAEHSLGETTSLTLAGDASVKRSQNAPDLDLMMLSAQPAAHWVLGRTSLGLGVNWQRIDVARARFRESHGVHADVLLPQGEHFWTAMTEVNRYEHRGDLSFMNARSTTVMMQRHQAKPAAGIDALDISVFAGREHNDRGLRELSNRSLLINTAIAGSLPDVLWPEVSWSAAFGWQQVRFDDTAFAEEPVRRDLAATLDLGIEFPLNESNALRVDYTQMRNRSTSRLYLNRYQQLTVTLRTHW
jgi:hypothetical protein